MGKTWFNLTKNWIMLLQFDLKHIHKVNFYPSDNNFTQALLVLLVTNMISALLLVHWFSPLTWTHAQTALQQLTFQPFKLSLCFLKYLDRNVFSCTFTSDFETLTPSPTSLLTPHTCSKSVGHPASWVGSWLQTPDFRRGKSWWEALH